VATKSWKNHEKSVAEFFFTKPLGHKPRFDEETPSDISVKVKDWLEATARYRPTEPWDSFIVECKYRKKDQDEAGWLRKFWKFYDGLPATVDTNMQIPVMLFKERWGIVRLGDWYGVYRAMFSSSLRNEAWLGQLMQLFYLKHTNLTAPAYFRGWLDGVGEIDTDLYGRTLPVICLGSSIARKGDGGGKVIIFNTDAGVP